MIWLAHAALARVREHGAGRILRADGKPVPALTQEKSSLHILTSRQALPTIDTCQPTGEAQQEGDGHESNSKVVLADVA